MSIAYRPAAIALIAVLFASTTHAAESQPSAEPAWLDDYTEATARAEAEGKMLLLHFVDTERHAAASETIDERFATDDSLQEKYADWVLARVSSDATIAIDGEPVRVLEHPAFRDMQRTAGIAVLDYAHEGAPYFGRVVSAYPFRSGKYYRWRADYLPIIAGLPAGTITQRTMVWAVREHHEAPQSTSGGFSPEIASIAANHSAYQARVRTQGHQNWSRRAGRVRSAVGLGGAVEVVAESWPGQTMIDSCLDCVASWRHSSGHWGAVKKHHRLFGYDLRRGGNGIWYGTGIFAD